MAPRRDECLKPPFTLLHDDPLVLDGMRVESRGDGMARELVLSSPSGAPYDADGLIAFRDRNFEALSAIHGVESTGLSGCPTRDGPMPCVRLGLRLCEEPLDLLAQALAAVVKNDAQARGRSVIFHVTLQGTAGPRCEANDAKCKPEPYEQAPYDPSARRGLIEREAPASNAPPDCEWDGECARSGCGNQCSVWTEAHRPGTCEERLDLRDALCGCVENHCAWFVQ